MKTLALDSARDGMQRGACPALSSPMSTGDGLLARIALADWIEPQELSQLCELACRHGNGFVDISARGNLQIRGLTEISAKRLDQDVRALQLPLREGLAVEVPPLAGKDPTELADPRELAAAIREGSAHIIGLAPKMTVVVDGHGQLRLSDLLADIRLVANPPGQGGGWTILLGGTEETGGVSGTLADADAIAEVLDLLRRLAASGRSARGKDLASALPHRRPSFQWRSPFGLHVLTDGQASVGVGPAFGQLPAVKLDALCKAAAAIGATAVRPALDHSLLFLGRPQACDELLAYAKREGFLTAAEDPRSSIAVCPGSPACASAASATHELAARVVDELADHLDGSFKLHVTGCQKGCAHPQPSPITLCATTHGVSFVAGRAGDRSLATVGEQDIAPALRRTSALLSKERRDGESSAACLARLGLEKLATILTSGKT